MICNLCHKEKDLDQFSEYKRNSSGYRYRCRECTNITYAEKYSHKRAQRYQDNREEILSKSKEKYKSSLATNLYKNAKIRANRLSLPFDISVDNIVVPRFCPILGVNLEVSEKLPSDNSPSLDRIIPELGYVVGNIQVISYKANRMKNDASWVELKLLADWILQNTPKINQEALQGP